MEAAAAMHFADLGAFHINIHEGREEKEASDRAAKVVGLFEEGVDGSWGAKNVKQSMLQRSAIADDSYLKS